jgi:DNA-binding NtrC family response regulator
MRRKVLVIDDSSLCRNMTKLVLERAGFEVITIGSPVGFGLVLHKEKPALALVDIAMPTLSGVELVIQVRKRLGPLCPILLYSERSQAELSRLAEQCGASGYIQKSSDWPSIAESVTRFITQSEREVG